MNGTSSERFLVQQGLLMFLAGLAIGGFMQAVANPRMMMGAHTGTLLTGTFIVALGSAWKHLEISGRLERATVWTLVASSWGVSVALVFAAIFATSRSTPIMGAGHAGAAWAEMISDVSLTVSSVGVLIAVVLIVRAVYAKPPS